MASKQAKEAIKKTNAVIKAMSALADCQMRITSVQDALERGEFSEKETCLEIIRIGQNIQRVSTMVRHYTSEGVEKRKTKGLNTKWTNQLNRNKNDVDWLRKNCKKPKFHDDDGSSVHPGRLEVYSHIMENNPWPSAWGDIPQNKVQRYAYQLQDPTWRAPFRYIWLAPRKKWLDENESE